MTQSAKIRVVLTITELDVGGAENCLTRLACGLDTSKFEPTVIVLDTPPARPHLWNELQNSGIPTHFLGTTRSTQIISAVRAMTRLLKDLQPDVIQSFLFHANVVTAIAARFAEVGPVLAGIRVADPSRWRSFLQRRLRNRFARFVCVSEPVAAQVRLSTPEVAHRVCVIPNGVDLTVPDPVAKSSFGLSDSAKLLVFVGRLTEQKGLDMLLRQLPDAFRQHEELHLLLVGEGEEEARLRQLADELNVSSRVHFVGWREDARAIIAAADALVLPSRWEGMPNVVLEAMAAGIPVVATEASGTESLLGHSPNQIVAPGELCAAVMQLMDNPPLRAACGEANRSAVKPFSFSAMIEQYQQLFTQALDL